MAVRVDRNASKAPAAQAAGADVGATDDLDILHPDRPLKIAGRDITVREYGFVEGQRLAPLLQPFQADLYTLITQGSTPPGYEQVAAVITKHQERVLQLVAASASVEQEWIESLSDLEGELLYVTWWVVNAGFFIRHALRQGALGTVANSSPSAGVPSTQA